MIPVSTASGPCAKIARAAPCRQEKHDVGYTRFHGHPATPSRHAPAHPRATGLDIQVSEDSRNFTQYPNPCAADLRLVSYQVGGAFVVGLIIRCARKPLLTFQTWLNPATTHDNQVLNSLRGDGDVLLHIITNQGRRAIKIPNVVRRDAARIANDIRNAETTWTAEQFDAACTEMDRQYPTAVSLYRAVAT
jgi:hypothetical protein